jgi:hypothetical protein
MSHLGNNRRKKDEKKTNYGRHRSVDVRSMGER